MITREFRCLGSVFFYPPVDIEGYWKKQTSTGQRLAPTLLATISLPEIFFVTTRNAVDKARNDTVNGSVYLGPGSAEGLGVYLKCLYISACIMRSKQGEPKTSVCSQICDVNNGTWCPSWSAGIEDYSLSRRDGQGRHGGWAAVYKREIFNCTVLSVRNNLLECLWVKGLGVCATKQTLS